MQKNKIKQSILVIDDNSDDVDVVKNIFMGRYRVFASLSGEKGLQRAVADPQPDLILLDVHMAGMNGYEVCEKLKANDKTKKIPVIFVSADNEVVSEVHGLNLGAVDFITKPLIPELVSIRVSTHLSLETYHHQLEYIIETNVKELEQQYEEIINKELLYRNLLDSIEDGVLLVDENGLIDMINPSVCNMFGYSQKELIGQPIEILIPNRFKNHEGKRTDFIKKKESSSLNRNRRSVFSHGQADIGFDHENKSVRLPGDLVAKRKNGSEFPVNITLSKIDSMTGKKVTVVVQDMTERKFWEYQLTSMAMKDALTGLANRAQFEIDLAQANRVYQSHQTSFALILIDLDNFKPVNDTYGHQAGDDMLRHIASILKKQVRDIDTVARLGGDEFAIIYVGEVDNDIVLKFSERIMRSINTPLIIGRNPVTVGCSIGININVDVVLDNKEIFRRADIALYESKNKGRNCATVYFDQEKRECPDINEQIKSNIHLRELAR